MLESSPKTADMVDLFKYLLYKATEKSYGVETFDFNEYNPSNFTNSGDTLIQYICSWENENLWDYMHGDANYTDLYVSTHVTEDGKYYKMRADAGTSIENNRNFGLGVCFYKNGIFMHEDKFKKYGIDITDSKYQQEGALLEVEIVDKVRDELIKDAADRIRDRAASEGVTLDDAQVAALLDISYNWGNIGNFFEVYKSVNQDRKNAAIRNIQAYDNYGNLGGYPLDGKKNSDDDGDNVIARENSRWKLFSEGIYKTALGKILTAETTSTGSYIGNTNHSASTTGEYGYSRIVKDSVTNKTYKVYSQGAYGGNIAGAGCSISSEAIVLSGYGINQTPQDRANSVSYFPRSLADIANDMSDLNVSSTAYITYNSGESVIQEAIQNIGNNLRDGKPVIILVRGSKYTSSAHYMALIGFNSQGKPVIADPAGGYVWEEDSLEDLVRYHVYAFSESNSEQGYVLINKK